MLLAQALASRRLVPLVRTTALKKDGFIGWLQQPDYQVDVSTGKAELLVSNADGCLSHVAADVSRLLRAGRETSETIFKLANHAGKSPAWFAVQAYYGAFYYASAFLKLAANNLTYARTSDLLLLRHEIQKLNPQPPIKITTGQWNFHFSPNAFRITVEKPANADGVHEATWKEFRRVLDQVKQWIPSSPFTDEERVQIEGELDNLVTMTQGVAGLPFLSSSRNDIQYRQALECWTPVAKNNKTLSFEQLAKLGWADDLDVAATDTCSKTDLERFVRRAMTICGAIHHTALLLAAEHPSAFLTHTYRKYHLSLLPAP